MNPPPLPSKIVRSSERETKLEIKRAYDIRQRLLEETGTECYCSDDYFCGRCSAKVFIGDMKDAVHIDEKPSPAIAAEPSPSASYPSQTTEELRAFYEWWNRYPFKETIFDGDGVACHLNL